MKSKSAILVACCISLTAAVASINPAVAADDNKFMSGAKAVGNGIMWAPKKIGHGIAAGFKAMGNGMKKMVGK
jgi:hypothetical protein